MSRLSRDLSRLSRTFTIFLAVVTVVSAFGGYQLYRLIYQMNDFSLQRADQLLEIEESLDRASIALGGQIQEWKDMLLRANDTDMYNRHRKAFMDSSVSVQDALINTKTAMQKFGMDTRIVDQLSDEHKSLVSSYMLAHARLDPRKIEFSHEVDKRVIGADRNLQQHLASVKSDIERLMQQQLSGAISEQAYRYWILGLLGAVSLLVMALAGFIFASRYYGQEIGAREHSPAT